MKRKGGRPARVAGNIKEQIFSEWVAGRAPGTPLPPEPELMRRYSVSRNTIRRVLAVLELENRVFRPPHGKMVVARYYDRQWWERYAGKEIGMLFPTPYAAFADPFCMRIAFVVLRGLLPTGLDLRFPSLGQLLPEKQKEPLALLALPEVVGLILVGRQSRAVMEALPALKKPVVAVDFDATAQGCDSFCFDNARAGALLARRLAKSGHRRALLLVEPADKPVEKRDEAWTERYAGFVSAWRGMSLPPPAEIYLPQRHITEAALGELKAQLSRPVAERPTALLVPGDYRPEIAPVLTHLRLKVPRDLTIVGFANSEDPPGLSGVRFDVLELGALALKGLLQQLCLPLSVGRRAKKVRCKGVYVAGRTHAPRSGRAKSRLGGMGGAAGPSGPSGAAGVAGAAGG